MCSWKHKFVSGCSNVEVDVCNKFLIPRYYFELWLELGFKMYIDISMIPGI